MFKRMVVILYYVFIAGPLMIIYIIPAIILAMGIGVVEYIKTGKEFARCIEYVFHNPIVDLISKP